MRRVSRQVHNSKFGEFDSVRKRIVFKQYLTVPDCVTRGSGGPTPRVLHCMSEVCNVFLTIVREKNGCGMPSPALNSQRFLPYQCLDRKAWKYILTQRNNSTIKTLDMTTSINRQKDGHDSDQ
jgi:hypothetical protein